EDDNVYREYLTVFVVMLLMMLGLSFAAFTLTKVLLSPNEWCESNITECKIDKYIVLPYNYMSIRKDNELKNTPENLLKEVYWIITPKLGKDGSKTEDTYLLTDGQLYYLGFRIEDSVDNITCYWDYRYRYPVANC